MKIWCDRANNQRVAWHCRSHPETAESNAYAEVFQLQRSFIGTSPVHVPTVADIQVVTRRPADERPAVILLELPNRHLGCQTYPYDDLVQISRLCRAANIRLHLDGARLWEIQPFYNRPFADLARLFDSVYVSLYKGLRGTVGCVLASSDAAFMAEAALWQRRLGGWMVTSYPVLIDCERAFNLNIGTFERKWRKMCAVAAAIVQATKDFTTSDGRPIVYFTPEVPTCCQVHTHIRGVTRERLAAARDEVERDLGLSVFPWTLPSPFMHELDPDWVLVNGDPLAVQGMDQYFEWSITDKNVDIPDAVFAQGWRAIVTVLFA
ncbi:hypothetical protein ASPZODRAFT_128961 [Penicilliopsis zonata CBS 506.65]|uniref:Aromatic amino acid beta-eliminating lyase/threonine aldolase domain-containing protein n=1 Tax=Penicilliopsis zonata CBS 506.65 TaxID=1073090 RepID=A0A1L9ST80_9EURO|nr:hypothetical protein ASPZODRAFT_128961 [Penicilliopsis zonata CBS 506.65]OJJ50346.1 hypothetical protein ASPZODRAFT_128961 [Penicilliopsis zonata CBS 506.65]